MGARSKRVQKQRKGLLRRTEKQRGGAMPFVANGIAPPLPYSAAFHTKVKQPKVNYALLPRRGRGTAKRWMRRTFFHASLRDGSKEPSGTKAENRLCCGRIWNPPLRRQDDIRAFSPYPDHSFHSAARRKITPQVFHLPTAAHFTRRRRMTLFNRPWRLNPGRLLRGAGVETTKKSGAVSAMCRKSVVCVRLVDFYIRK